MEQRRAAHAQGICRQDPFGAFKANSDISLAFEPGARHAIIGPNGAGKTTFINLLTGVLAPTRATSSWATRRSPRLPQHARVKRGMTRTFQINTLFPGLTVLESVVLACCERDGAGTSGGGRRRVRSAQIDEARGFSRNCVSTGDAAMETRNLPYGKQRLLEIALALATRPTGPAARRARGGHSGGGKRRAVRRHRGACRATSRSSSSSTTWTSCSGSPSASRCWSAARC